MASIAPPVGRGWEYLSDGRYDWDAEIDEVPELLAEKLEQAGVDVRHKTFHGSTHEFFGMAAVVPDAAAAQTFAAHELKRAFGTAILPI